MPFLCAHSLTPRLDKGVETEHQRSTGGTHTMIPRCCSLPGEDCHSATEGRWNNSDVCCVKPHRRGARTHVATLFLSQSGGRKRTTHAGQCHWHDFPGTPQRPLGFLDWSERPQQSPIRAPCRLVTEQIQGQGSTSTVNRCIVCQHVL